jgi:hypothetical protein
MVFIFAVWRMKSVFHYTGKIKEVYLWKRKYLSITENV